MKTTFGSDNFSTVDPKVMEFLQQINQKGHAQSYDGDSVTAQARAEFRELFGEEVPVLFVSTGTAANILSIKLLLEKPYDAVVTSNISHIYEEETGALAANTSSQIFPLSQVSGKISLDDLKKDVSMRKTLGEHSANPKVLSIANSTEVGTIYTPEEVKLLADFCHANDMYLHMDGCRLPNVVAELGCNIKDLTINAGVDVLSFGGAKNGLMNAEAVVIFDAPKSSLLHMQKQVMQLNSKARYISGQFIPYLRNGLWIKNAKRANEFAKQIREVLEEKGVPLTQQVVTNQIFCILPKVAREILHQAGHQFYDWNAPNEIRLVTSWDSNEVDVEQLIKDIRGLDL